MCKSYSNICDKESNTEYLSSVEDLLKMDLDIPDYQRPYKWNIQNIKDLLFDITNAISDYKKYNSNFKYRIGTIILHKENDKFNIVDGQQRIISLILIKLNLDKNFNCSVLNKGFTNKTSKKNIHDNYEFINNWLNLNNENYEEIDNAFKEILEVVVIIVDEITEAFQLFDSQNTRGKSLYPHDLLKAYHLREMKENQYEMERAVEHWEEQDSKHIKELFDLYLFSIWNWSHSLKSKPFTEKEIDVYKGISENSEYTYAKRTNKAMPYFQITEPFISGKNFFEMVDHYLHLIHDIKLEIFNNPNFKEIKAVLCAGKELKSVEEMDSEKFYSVGFVYTKNLFYCALLYYFDKFHNFKKMPIKKLFTWAFMLRVDMEYLGYNSVNKYSIGDKNSKYSNNVAMFAKLNLARTDDEISELPINIENNSGNNKWQELYNSIKKINGYEDIK